MSATASDTWLFPAGATWQRWLPVSVPVDGQTPPSRLLSGIRDVVIDPFVLTTLSEAVRVASRAHLFRPLSCWSVSACHT